MNEQMVKGASAPNGDFALGFQPDGVQLLHRHGNAWAELGKAAFDGELRSGLGGFVRQLRAANAPSVSLVIPNAQILYTDLVLPAAADTPTALKAGLDGLTPYRVDELAFDYTPADAKPGTTVKVAAVWRQTLQEAEDFAVRHGFAPNRFVAAPSAGQFPRAPDFGATGLAAEWELASAELTGLDLPEPASVPVEPTAEVAAPVVVAPPVVAAPSSAPAARPAPVLAAPALSRITPHVVPTPIAPLPAKASVNLGSIILPGEAPLPEVAEDLPSEVVPMAELPVQDEAPANPEPRPVKPLPDRARAFHERATEARKTRPAPTAGARAPVAPGRRSGLGGALPLVGLLVLGLGISAALIGRDDAELAATPEMGETAAPVASAPTAPANAPIEPVERAAAPVAQPPAAPQPAPQTVANAPETVVPADEARNAEAVPVATAPIAVPPVEATPAATAPAEASQNVAVAPEVPAASADAAMAAAISAAYAATQPLVSEPAPLPEAESPPAAPVAASAAVAPPQNTATASPAPAATRAARPIARPQGLARAASQPAATPRREAAPVAQRPAAATGRPTSRPAAATNAPGGTSAPTASGRNPGAPASATLVRSARPKTAPSRSEPARATPDARPAVPRSPQPYEQRQQTEPSGSRPPPKPVTQSSADGAVLHSQPAPRHFAFFSIRSRDAVLAQMERPWIALPAPQAGALIRTAEARPARRPTRTDATTSAVDAAVSEAIGGATRPTARASTAAAPVVASAPAAAGTVGSLNRSARPAHRPGSVGGASASTAGISQATDTAVEAAIADAVSNSSAVPGRVALLPLTSSARPSWRGGRSGGGNAPSAGGNSGNEGTLAPEPQQNAGQSKADAEAAALAERRNLDDELQRQAEQRVRERAASDARAAAQAKAAAEARARAQAEAEAAAAARRNQTYRPPEVDNEPEVASAERAPTGGAVGGSATSKGIDLNATQLIGTVGAGKASRGLIRLRNGRIVTVRLGDKINGGQISSIGNGGLKYVKAGREYSLPILNGR